MAPNLRPEAGLLAIRKGLGLFANIRPAYLYKELAEACPLKKEIIGDGFDMVIMRELTGGLYFGDRYTRAVSYTHLPSYYFDLKLHLKNMKPDSYANPYTPPVSLYYTCLLYPSFSAALLILSGSL